MVRTGIVALALVGGLVLAGPTGAAKFKQLGKVAPNPGAGETCGDCNTFQFATAPTSPSYVVPKGKWKIVSWRAAGPHPSDGAGHARLRIYRPTGVTDQFKIVKESDDELFPAGKVKEHKTKIRVRKGDHLGIRSVGSMLTSYDSNKGQDVMGAPAACSLSVGSTIGPEGSGSDCDLNEFGFSRTNVAVTLKRR
jgi:hypothetical protein